MQQIIALLESVGNSFCPDNVDWFGRDGGDVLMSTLGMLIDLFSQNSYTLILLIAQRQNCSYNALTSMEDMTRFVRLALLFELDKSWPVSFNKFYQQLHCCVALLHRCHCHDVCLAIGVIASIVKVALLSSLVFYFYYAAAAFLGRWR
ncbi:hypothetical protein Dimus_022149 [Dionaea muscipula]